MKSSVVRIAVTCAICTCLFGIAGSALAQGNGMKDLRAQMVRLKIAKRNARASHHPAQVHYIQSLINRLQVRIDNHR